MTAEHMRPLSGGGQMRGMDEAPLRNYAGRIAASGRQIGFDGLHLTEIKNCHGSRQIAGRFGQS